MTIQYTSPMQLQLWVWDTGEVEGFSVFVNGGPLPPELVDRKDYSIARPSSPLTIVVQFSGADGGATKIVDVAGGGKRVVKYQDTGMTHEYVLTP